MTDQQPINNTLLPCPFCGGDAEFKKLVNIRPFVQCKGRTLYEQMENIGFMCGAKTGYYSTDEEAIRAWNTRI